MKLNKELANWDSDIQQNQEITLEEARKILAETADALTDEQLQDQISKIQYLVESWVDDY